MTMDSNDPLLNQLRRRHFLGGAGVSLGALALEMLRNPKRALAAPGKAKAKAKNVIYLHMCGAPSQLDLWDYKPKLQKLTGKPCPKEFLEGKRFAFIKGVPTMLGTMHTFGRHGQSGAELSNLLPNFAKVVDDVAIIKSMVSDEFNHAPGQLFQHTGTNQFGGAPLGAWVNYGLGSENKDLPGFVVMLSGSKNPDAGKSLWGSGFLPSINQGVQCRTTGGDPVLYLADPPGMSRDLRRRTLDSLKRLNEIQQKTMRDPETETRIAQYELAFRMQASVPKVMDLTKEPQHVLDLYGARPGFRSESEGQDDPRSLYKGTDSTFANNCLLARRLVEQGVRFVQIYDWGWDHHGGTPNESIDKTLPIKAQQIDRAMTGLILDLKQRGMLDDTLVIWGSEFGRTPMQQNPETQAFIGRDHHKEAFTMWMAGGGVRGGQTYGETDDMGYYVTKDKVHVRDVQAMILHQLGLDPWRLTYPYQGLDQKLIGVEGHAKIHEKLVG
jgi:hypothetical protein